MVPIRETVHQSEEVPVEYGVEFLPIHHKAASVNYPWLQHNVTRCPNTAQVHDRSFNREINSILRRVYDSASSTFGLGNCIQTERIVKWVFAAESRTTQHRVLKTAPESILNSLRNFGIRTKIVIPEQWESVTPTRKYFISVSISELVATCSLASLIVTGFFVNSHSSIYTQQQ
jgi:hypothetical protein